MNLKNIKEIVFSFSLCLLFIFSSHINSFATCIYQSTTTDGQYIYQVENNKIYKYDMQGKNKMEIYEGLPYEINIEGLYDNYLYFNEFTEDIGGIGANCNLKVLNTNDNTFKVITNMQSHVQRRGNKLYIYYAIQGEYYFESLYCADIDGNNYKLISEISNLNYKVIDDKLYYIELMVLDSGYKHRVIKSDLDGSNPELVIDWFDSDSAYLNEKGVIWNRYTDGSNIYFIKDYETKQDNQLDDNNHYWSFQFVDDQDYVYLETNNYKTKRDSFIFFKTTDNGNKKEVGSLKDCPNTICFINIIDGKLYYRQYFRC